MTILLTGGLGYIGSHTCVALLNAGHEVVVIDNLVNSKASVAGRITQITGKPFHFVELDLRNRHGLDQVFQKHRIDAVIHFAGLKAVGESVRQPLHYYDNNLTGTLALLEIMQQYAIKKLVFSSSATVYGNPASVPIFENFPLATTNPYGRSKLMIEDMLRDLFIADPGWHIALLRYFNPVGAHHSGLIGEDPHGVPNNLMPFIARVAHGQSGILSVFGGDYPTIDGTGVRDYIHVVDLASGHIRTLQKLNQGPGVHTYNLGTGKGTSVLEMVHAFEQASGRPVPYQIVARRAGDVASCYADVSLAERELSWKAERNMMQMCEDTWRWQTHPDVFSAATA